MNIAKRVARGVALLDYQLVNWEHQIDVNTLDMDSVELCIVGQLFEDRVKTSPFFDYRAGLYVLLRGAPSEIRAKYGSDVTKLALKYGFDVAFDGSDFPKRGKAMTKLREEWTRVIESRVAA